MCLFAVVGGMPCKSDKPSFTDIIVIVILNILAAESLSRPGGTLAAYDKPCISICYPCCYAAHSLYSPSVGKRRALMCELGGMGNSVQC